MTTFIYASFVLPLLVLARIEEDVMPNALQDCYTRSQTLYSSRYQVQSSCLNNYLLQLFGNNTYHGLDVSILGWLDLLGRKIHVRLKRQANTGLRKRKEIRTLTETERADFFEAVNALKQEKIPSYPHNKYDAIAVLHKNTNAHDGYNFPSWHRYYLVLFEEALRTKNRRVTLPYWDSRTDFRMRNPANTILFTEIFLGNGRGVVYTGPFALWRTPNENSYLRRNIGTIPSSLIDPTKIQSVLNKRYHREILTPTAATDEDNLEHHHDSVHAWVGGDDGHMNDLDTSSMDPVFFLHHCFVDYLWEQFRKRQISLGINPETDYPPTTVSNQQPNDLMANLSPPKKNIDGYSNSFTREIFTYADAPTCQNNCGGAPIWLLKCDKSQNGCVSRSRREFIDEDKGFLKITKVFGTNVQQIASAISKQPSGDISIPSKFEPEKNPVLTITSSSPLITRKFTARIVDSRTRLRKRRSVYTEGKKINIDLNINLHFKPESRNFSSNPINMAATPIMITNVHQRNTHIEPVQNHKTFNITLQTDGFTYKGRHIGNVIIDERSVSTDIVAYIAFEKPPKRGDSKAFVTVYDSYGGVCMPSCLMSRSTYRDCTGVIKITNEIPLMYTDLTNEDPGAEITPFLRFSCNN